MVTLFGLLITVTGYFFINTTVTAENGSLINKNQTIKNKLEAENRTLKQQVIDAQSIYTINNEAQTLEQPVGTYFIHPRRPLSSRTQR